MARTFTSADGLKPEDLFHSAHDHASAAMALVETSPSHLDSAGYLAHIAVELLLKAWLLSCTGEFKGIHSIQALHQRAREACGAPELPAHLLALLQALDSYAELRYPNRAAPTEVGTEDLAQLWELVECVYASFPVHLQQAIQHLDPTKKGGRVLMKKKIAPAPGEDA